MNRAAALVTCRSLLEDAVDVPGGIAGTRAGVRLTIAFRDESWEICTVRATHGHGFLLVANPGDKHVGFRWLDGRSYESLSSPPALLEDVLRKNHIHGDDRQVDRWERLALSRLEAKNDVLCATFADKYYGVDAELLRDGVDAVLRLHAATGNAIAALPDATVTLPSASEGAYRSAPVQIVSPEALPRDYAQAMEKLERVQRERRIIWRIRVAAPLCVVVCLVALYLFLYLHAAFHHHSPHHH